MACCNPVKCAMMQSVVLVCIATGAATVNYFGATEQRSFIDDYLSSTSNAKVPTEPATTTLPKGGAQANPGTPETIDPTKDNDHADGAQTKEPGEQPPDPNRAFSIDALPEMITVDEAVKLYNLPYEDPNAPMVFFFDAREPEEYLKGHIPAAYNVTPQSFFEDTLPAEIDEWPKDSIIVVYCAGGNCDASHLVETRLKQQKSFTRVCVIHAGYPGWRDLGLPTESGPRPSN